MFQHAFNKAHARDRARVPSTVPPIEECINTIIHGDCTQVMKVMPAESIDLVVTDPPYLVNYTSRDGQGLY